jgi:hypothetical protein
MFETFDFERLQLRYVKAAMEKIPSFRPDGKAPADAQAVIDDAQTVRTNYLNAQQIHNLAIGELEEIRATAHLLCVQVYPIMKSRYRNDPGSLSAINKLPVEDKTLPQTLERMEKISVLWGHLPNPPGSATPFKAWDTMDKAAFDAVLAPLSTQAGNVGTVTQEFELQEGNLHTAIDAMEDFVTAALIQGRAQFLSGPNREVIDAIPMEPAQQPPGQAVISAATSPAAGAVHLAFDAPGGTSFDVLHKGPGDADFSIVDDDTIERVYDATGLAAGSHDYKVIPRNSRGPGPESAVSTIVVA